MGQARAVVQKKELPISDTESSQEEIKPLAERIADLQAIYQLKQAIIQARLNEFESFWRDADNFRLFEELVFCIFTAGASAKMGLNCIERIRTYFVDSDPRQTDSRRIA